MILLSELMSQMPRASVPGMCHAESHTSSPDIPTTISYPLPTYQYHCTMEKWAIISVPLHDISTMLVPLYHVSTIVPCQCHFNVSIILPCQYHFTMSAPFYHISTIVTCQYYCTMSIPLYHVSTITLALYTLVLRTGQMSMECSIKNIRVATF